jgi:hypothetical protein
LFTEVQHETGYKGGGEPVHTESAIGLKQAGNDTRGGIETDTFVKVAVEFFSRGWVWWKHGQKSRP